MALMQELTNQGRVVGGHLTNGEVKSDQFSKGALSIQHPLNPFRRQKISTETVAAWEELATEDSVVGAMGHAAARAALPSVIGKAVSAGLSVAGRSGHTVRVDWLDGKQSVIELPEKQFLVFSVLLNGQQVVTENSAQPRASEPTPEPPGVAERIVGLATSVINRGKSDAPAEEPTDVVDQIKKLASLRDAGILTDQEFADKKAELLKRL